jgi:tetratricopeptide (TPR) repeat protein
MDGKLDRKIAAVEKLRRRTAKDPEKEPEFAAALVELADDFKEAGRSQEATAAVREARQIYQARVSEWRPDDLLLAASLSREATWLAEEGDPAAERLFADEADIYQNQTGEASVAALGLRLTGLAGVMFENLRARRYRSGESAARVCIELARQLVGKDKSAETTLVSTHNSLALSLIGQGKFDEAHHVAARAVEIAQQAAVWGRPVDKDASDLAHSLMLSSVGQEGSAT